MITTTRRWVFLLVGILLAVGLCIFSVARARAGGPMLVGGTYGVPGQPFRWNPASFPVTYWTDRGNLGSLNEDQANALVKEAFDAWENVATASISFRRDGPLGTDITASNVTALFNRQGNCTQPLADLREARTIIYDADGSILQALGKDPNTVLGFAGVVCISTDGTNNSFERGRALLNGKFIDGVKSGSNPEVTLDEFKAVFIHEFGHFSGLDHAQINLNCLTAWPCGSDDLEGLPTMFPVLVHGAAMTTLSTDDIAAISSLYPEPAFATSFGKIQGQILFSDGVTPAQGFNVIARQVGAPRRIAVSSVSGFLFTACEGNPVTLPPYNDCGGDITPFGSRDQNLIGFYEISVPSGQYTVEVEEIHTAEPRPFVNGSSVGPIGELGFQFPLPGPAEFWNWGESDTDVPTDSNPVTVTAGAVVTDINIILNDTPPRFDAWETARLLRWLRQLVARLDRRFAWTEM